MLLEKTFKVDAPKGREIDIFEEYISNYSPNNIYVRISSNSEECLNNINSHINDNNIIKEYNIKHRFIDINLSSREMLNPLIKTVLDSSVNFRDLGIGVFLPDSENIKTDAIALNINSRFNIQLVLELFSATRNRIEQMQSRFEYPLIYLNQ